jgi:hypothetical protein
MESIEATAVVRIVRRPMAIVAVGERGQEPTSEVGEASGE